MTDTIGISIPARQESGAQRAIRSFLETNYLYVISAGLMILGCFLLMRQTPVAGGELQRVLTGLMVLQGYELLILGTIGLIRRRLPTIEDTLTLVGVQMVLLFDPTFFANNLHTLVQSDHANPIGPFINLAVFTVFPLKLWLIARLNGFTLASTVWGYLMILAAMVYLGPALLASTDPFLGRTGTFLALCWLMAGAFVLPPNADEVITQRRERIRSTLHFRWVPRFFLHVPAILLILHLGETWFVHKVNFHGAFIAPLLIAIGSRVVFHSQFFDLLGRVTLLDLLATAALICSIPATGITPKEVFNAPEPFFESLGTVGLTGLMASLVYTVGAIRFKALWMMGRPALMAAGVAVYTLHQVGFLELAWTHAVWLFNMLSTWWIVAESAAFAGALLYCLYKWDDETVMLLGVWLALILVRFQSINLFEHFAELYQVVILFAIAGVLMGRGGRYQAVMTLSVFVFAGSIGRAVLAPFDWSHQVVFIEGGVLLVAGLIYGRSGAVAMGGAAAALMAGWIFRAEILALGAPALVIAASLVAFAAAVYVSFAKERLMAMMDRDADDAASLPATADQPVNSSSEA